MNLRILGFLYFVFIYENRPFYGYFIYQIRVKDLQDQQEG